MELVMRRWKIILIAVISALSLIIGGGLFIFHFFVVPRYVDPFLKTAAELLENEDVQHEISALAQEFADKGLLDDELLKQYLEMYSEATKKDKLQQSTSQQTATSNNTASENSVGAKDIHVQENDSGPRYSYGKNTSSESLIKVEEKADNPKPTDNTSDTEKSLYQRIKENVSPKDLSRGYELAAKLNISKVRSLMSDRSALKEYIRSVFTESEYSEIVAFYLKYSYLLKDY